MATIFKFGNSNWAVKEDYALAYSDENNNFKSLPIDFTRASTATQVNKDGLIETVDRGMPRIDFLNNTKGHFLSEPSRTNLIAYSEDFTEWDTTQNATLASDDAISPDGSVNATKITDDSTSGNHRIFTSLTTTAASHTFSIYLKKGTMTTAFLRFLSGSDIATANVDLEAGTITATAGTAKIEDAGSDWYRCSITGTAAAGTSYVYVYMKQLAGYVGTSQDLFLWGAQVEAGGYVTSYIPTVGTTVTRVADDSDCITGRFIEMNDAASVYYDVLGHPQGSGITNSSKSISALFYSTDVNKSYVSLNANGTNWKVRVQDFTSSNFKDTAISQTENIKCVVVMNTSGFSVYANGNTIVSNQSYNGTSPAGFINQLKQIDIYNGSDDRGVYKIRDMRVFDSELTEAEAQALTS